MASSQRECNPPTSFKPHAVVLPLPFQGHITPLMHLSKQLASHGFTITFLNSHLNHLRFLASLPPLQLQSHDDHKLFVPYLQDQGLDLRLIALPGGTLPPDQLKTATLEDVVRPVFDMGSSVEDLIRRLQMDADPPVTCLITDLRIPFAQDVADKFKIPRIGFWTQSAASYASNLVMSKGYRLPADDTTLITCIPGAPPHKRSEVTAFLTAADPSDFLFDFATRPFKRLGEAAGILINTFDELEGVAMEALRKEREVLTIGPLLPSAAGRSAASDIKNGFALWPENYACLEWLDNHPPSSVLYISFGSVVYLSAQQLEELALGLEASQQKFLWALRPDVMSGSSPNFPDGFLHRVQDRAMIVPWAPQLHVLSHPSVGGFVTHCGWNSMLESISRGIPMLGWPNFADQMLNLRCMVDGWRIGTSVEVQEDGTVSRVEVEKKVRELMQGRQGREVRNEARALGRAATKAVAEGGSSNTNFEVFVDWLKSQSPSNAL